MNNKKPESDTPKWAQLPTFDSYMDEKYGPVGTPERDAFIADFVEWAKHLDDDNADEQTETSRPRILPARLRRVAVL